MARKAKDNPTNLAGPDVASELKYASNQLVSAQDALEAAREPVRGAKAIVKAAGIDFDIFKLCHGIRHLDDDDARQTRIRKLQVAIAALLGDKVQLDLFGFTMAQARPAVGESLREASDVLQGEEADNETGEADDELPFDPPTVPTFDEEPEDIPALVVADGMPEGAGFAYNKGLMAGRQGFDADANPYDANGAEAKLWEDGRQQGAAALLAAAEEEDSNEDHDAADDAVAEASVVEIVSAAEQKRGLTLVASSAPAPARDLRSAV